MRDAALFGARLLLGGYMGIHASQKLFGKFHGLGLEGQGALFDKGGFSPGKQMAATAAATELAGGALTVTGIAWPAGPLAVAGAMSVAATYNRKGGLMAIRGGVELPVSYVTLALTLAVTGPGKYKIGPSLPSKLTALGAIAGGALAGAMITRMVTATPPPDESAADEPAADEPPADQNAADEPAAGQPAADESAR